MDLRAPDPPGHVVIVRIVDHGADGPLDLGPCRFQLFEGDGEDVPEVRVAVLPETALGQTEPNTLHRARLEGLEEGEWIAPFGVYTAEEVDAVGDRPGECSDGVEGAAELGRAVRGESPFRRLVTHHPGERGRNPNGAAGVRSESEERRSFPEADSRTARRPPGYASRFRIPRIVWRAPVRVHPDTPVRELHRVGLARDDRTGPTDAIHQPGVRRPGGFGQLACRPGVGGHVLCAVDVLHRNRNAAEWTARSGGERQIGVTRRGQGGAGVEVLVGVECFPELPVAGDGRLAQLDRGKLPLTESPSRLGYGPGQWGREGAAHR